MKLIAALLLPAFFVPGALAQGLPDFTPLVRKAGPAVVNIVVTQAAAKPQAGAHPGQPGQQPFGGQPAPQMPDELQDFFRRFMPDMPPPGPRQGMGSGFIISADGYIVTNAHVVANAAEVTVRLADAKREYKAKVVGSDERTDIALLKVEAKGLPTAQLGSSSKIEPGQWVAAIGSPFGFRNTITAGIVSATGRSLPAESFVPFIQTDVAINPGNSGGPLINLDGEVVGVNSMIYSGTGGYMGVSFAIPIEIALDVTKQLQATGKVTRGRIGVAIQPVTKELAAAFGMKDPRGALISSVEPGSPADKAGLRTGDVVTGFGGKPVPDANALPRLVASTKPGQASTIEVFRDGKSLTLDITAAELPSGPMAQAGGPAGGGAGGKAPQLGISVAELTPEQRKTLGVPYGLVVQSVEKPNLPLRQGDVIVGVNRQGFQSLDEFKKLVSQHQGDTVALLVRRGEASIYVPVEVG